MDALPECVLKTPALIPALLPKGEGDEFSDGSYFPLPRGEGLRVRVILNGYRMKFTKTFSV